MTMTQERGSPLWWRRLALIGPLTLFVIVAGFFLYALRSGDPTTLPSVLIGKPVPEFSLAGVDSLMSNGRPVPGFSHTDLAKGTVSIVNVWASWCGPCHKEHPFLVELKNRSKAPLFGINYKDKAVNARRFLGRYGNPFVAVGVDSMGRVAIDWGVYGVPETYIVNGAGQIIYRHVGPISPRIIDEILIPVIQKARNS